MTEKRFKPHIFDDGVNERYFDGIIDNEDDNEVIVNYQYISNLLNNLHEENQELKQAYNDAKKDVEKKEQILKDIMKDNLLIQDIEKELEE